MDILPFTIVHLIKSIDINLAKEVKDLYKENSKLLKIEKKDIPCSYIGGFNSVKTTILPKPIYRFNAIQSNSPLTLHGNGKDTEVYMKPQKISDS